MAPITAAIIVAAPPEIQYHSVYHGIAWDCEPPVICAMHSMKLIKLILPD